MLVSAAVCPHPPALVPAISQGAAGLLADLRTECVTAVRALAAVGHDALVCVGSGPTTQRWGASAGGTMKSFGVDATFGEGDRVLPPALTIAAYLLEEAAIEGALSYQAVAFDASPEECRVLGAELAASADRVALLVMGDGSAKRTTKSPGYYDPRAEPFDAEAVRALAEPDPDALLRIDPLTAADLWVAGRPSWQVLAGALDSSARPRLKGRVTYDDAPFGVGYVVVLLMAE